MRRPLNEDVAVRLGALLDLGSGGAQRVTDAVAVGQDLRGRRPGVRGRRPEAVPFHGIDPAREQVVEGRVERRPPQDAAADLVPGEGGQVPQIEDEGLAQADGLRGQRPGSEELEERVGPGPRPLEVLTERMGSTIGYR